MKNKKKLIIIGIIGLVVAAAFLLMGPGGGGKGMTFTADQSDARTPKEVREDMKKTKGEDVLAIWNFTQKPADGVIADMSGNGYDVHVTWFTEKTQAKGDYSFVLVGDTQIVNYEHPEKLADIYDWIVRNKEEKKIEYVLGLGDITDKSTPEEWENAKTQIAKLDGVVGYSLVCGNHDVYFQFNDAFKDTPLCPVLRRSV